jgi:MHS family alpha-ketoglutarate permease-like MFS transporter
VVSSTQPDVAVPQSRVRQLAAASVGNLVEWYDWYAYSFLAIYFSGSFFPSSDNPLVPLLSTFAVFAVGFFMRPIGGLVLGSLADRFGRRAALTLTIALMGGGGLLMAVSPTYAQVGVLAPIVLVLARLVQGLSIGGEFAASTTFLVESAPPNRRGLFSSFQYVSTTVGQLVASGLAALLANTLTIGAMQAYGWRLMFVVGAAASFTGLWIRRGAVETHRAAEHEYRRDRRLRPRLFEFVTTYPGKAALVVGITIAGTISYYTWTVYLPTYAQLDHGFSPGNALIVSTIALVFFGMLQPLAGMLSDRIGRKPMLLAFSAGLAVLTVPLLHLVSGFVSLLVVALVAMVFLSGYTSIAATVMVELFPTRVRAAGIGFPYSFTVALFGGTAPYVGTALVEHELAWLFPWYLVVLTAISFFVYLFLRETKDAPLPG